jgi:hypothetical protein
MRAETKATFVLIFLLAVTLSVTSCGLLGDDEPTRTASVGRLIPTQTPTVHFIFDTATPVGDVNVDSPPTATVPSVPSDPAATATPSPQPDPTNTSTPGPNPPDPSCLDAVYVADVTIPDYTSLEPGQEFVKTWRVRNNGTCAWPAGTTLVFDSGDRLDAPASVNVAALDVGETTDVSARMAAPAADGTYEGVWRFSDASAQPFGTYLTVIIRVGSPPPTSPAQPTADATLPPTSTPQPSPTLAPGQPSPTPLPPSPTPVPPTATSPPPPPPTATSPPPPPDAPPVGLRNGNFEADWGQESSHRCLALPVGGGPYTLDVGNIFTPPGWVCWFQHQEGEWAQPEGRDSRARDPDRMRSGSKGYVNFTFHRKHDAGLYQQVSVAPGTKLRFTAWAHAWSNHADKSRPDAFPHPDDPRWSDGAGYERVAWAEGSQPPTGDPQVDARTNMTFWVGIDPTGGTNPFAGSVVWSQGWHIYNGFVQPVTAEATAQSGTVTVFLRSRTKWPFKHNDAYWDDAELVAVP